MPLTAEQREARRCALCGKGTRLPDVTAPSLAATNKPIFGALTQPAKVEFPMCAKCRRKIPWL